MKFFIGCSGWQYDHWNGRFYPENCPKAKWFEYYTQHFNTVEINSSFYHFPKTDTLRRWYFSSPKNFKFSLKAYRGITHYKKFNNTKTLIKNFYKTAEELEDKLGPILFQLPKNIKFKQERLKLITSQLSNDFKNVIEFRDDSWWREDVRKYLKKSAISFCSLSAPQLPEDIIYTGGTHYFRFHGKNRWYEGSYSKSDLLDWSDIITSRKFKEVWVYFNNDQNAYAPNNAMNLYSILNKDYLNAKVS